MQCPRCGLPRHGARWCISCGYTFPQKGQQSAHEEGGCGSLLILIILLIIAAHVLGLLH